MRGTLWPRHGIVSGKRIDPFARLPSKARPSGTRRTKGRPRSTPLTNQSPLWSGGMTDIHPKEARCVSRRCESEFNRIAQTVEHRCMMLGFVPCPEEIPAWIALRSTLRRARRSNASSPRPDPWPIGSSRTGGGRMASNSGIGWHGMRRKKLPR